MNSASGNELLDAIEGAKLHGCELEYKELLLAAEYEVTLRANGKVFSFRLEYNEVSPNAFFSPQPKQGFSNRVVHISDLKRKLSSVCKKFGKTSSEAC